MSTLAVSASATVGRAFFHNQTNGLDYSCSASALNSGSKELVLTAGHCVHGGAGGTWMTNWVFVPLYNYGSQPYGQWSAKYFTTFNSWISSSDLNRDVAMVTMSLLRRRGVQHVRLGGQPDLILPPRRSRAPLTSVRDV